MNSKFILIILSVLLTVYSAYGDSSIIGTNPCQELNSSVCGSDGYTYRNVYDFCQVNGNNSNEYILANGSCCSAEKRYCDNLNYKILKRERGNGNGKHVATISNMCDDCTTESQYGLLTDKQPDSVQLYACPIDQSTYLARDPGCDARGPGDLNVPFGYIFTKQQCNTIPLFLCHNAVIKDYMISTDAACEAPSYKAEALLGFVQQY